MTSPFLVRSSAFSRSAPVLRRPQRGWWCAWLLVGLLATVSAAEPGEGGWSSALLQQILNDAPAQGRAAVPAADTAGTKSRRDAAPVTTPATSAPMMHVATSGASAPVASPEPAPIPKAEPLEYVLHTYRLLHLRVGEAGKTQNVLAILQKLLPAGSSLNIDVPENSVHVLTTAAAHQAVWDYLSAVDTVDTGRTAAKEIPAEVRTALDKLAASSDEAARIARSVTQMQATVDHGMATMAAREHRQAIVMLIGFGIFAAAGITTLAWTVRRRPAKASVEPPPSTALALAPEQLATVLTPVHDRMRTDMLGLLNEVGIKLQAQHQEQQLQVQEQQRQLETARQALADERRQFIAETGSLVVQAVERVDATALKLAKQQDKVAELVQELQSTVRELDVTKDSLRDREIELEQERAKIAALSLLLEEGAPLPATNVNGHASALVSPLSVGESGAIPRFDRPERCTTQAQPGTPPERRAPLPLPPTFLFLSPDQAET